MSAFPDHIYKAYDIRGIYPDELNEDVAYRTARAYAALLSSENPGKQLTVAVGRDMRTSSPALAERVIAGLVASGVNVVDIGLVSTPTYYFAVAEGGYDGGMQVSASHNPKEYNGLKLVRRAAVPVSKDTGIMTIRDIARENSFTKPDHTGTVTTQSGFTEQAVTAELGGIDISAIKPLTIVVDAANAMGALDIEALFKVIPGTIIKLNFELDGTFPSHQPDPLDEDNLKVLQDAIAEHGADLGIAPDGDGDRCFFVDEQGQVIRQEILRGIMAKIELAEHPGATVCYDIRPGRITRDMIEAAGGRGVVTPVGHSLIKEVMLKEDAVFGGESSGHYFYKFPFGTFESPVVLIAKFLQFISSEGTSVSAAVQPYRKYFHSGEINSEVADVAAVLEKIKTTFADGEQNLLDGVTVEYPDWWFNVRGSNTEPKIRLNLEARSKELMEKKRDEVLTVIRGS